MEGLRQLRLSQLARVGDAQLREEVATHSQAPWSFTGLTDHLRRHGTQVAKLLGLPAIDAETFERIAAEVRSTPSRVFTSIDKDSGETYYVFVKHVPGKTRLVLVCTVRGGVTRTLYPEALSRLIKSRKLVEVTNRVE